MRHSLIMLIALFLLITGCSKQKVNQPSGSNKRTAEENQIVQLAYNINYLYLSEWVLYKNDSGYYENTVIVTPLSQRKKHMD